jgi:hypothetical protein
MPISTEADSNDEAVFMADSGVKSGSAADLTAGMINTVASFTATTFVLMEMACTHPPK